MYTKKGELHFTRKDPSHPLVQTTKSFKNLYIHRPPTEVTLPIVQLSNHKATPQLVLGSCLKLDTIENIEMESRLALIRLHQFQISK